MVAVRVDGAADGWSDDADVDSAAVTMKRYDALSVRLTGADDDVRL